MKLVKEKQPRKFQTITEISKRLHLIEKYFINRPYFIKGTNGTFVQAVEKTEDTKVVIDTKEKLNHEITMYNILKKYVEFKGTVEQSMSPERYLVNIHSVNIAAEERKHQRYSVDMNTVSVSNFRASRNVINASLFNIPTSVKVHLKQYQQILWKEADEVFVDVFDKSREKLEIVRKSGKILFVADTSKPESYESPDSEKFVDYVRSSDQDISALMREYKYHKIVSEMIVPVVYTGHDGIAVPLGFIQLISKSKPIKIEKADDMLRIGSEIVQKMRDSNTVMINEKQKIENISMDGMSIRVTHPELKKLMPEQIGLTFDVIFKLTQPLTVSTEVIYMGRDADDLIIGVKIIGFATKSADSNRYYSMVNMLS